MRQITPSILLHRAARLIRDPARWTQGALARDHEGNIVSVSDPLARCFCAEGALLRIAHVTGAYSVYTPAEKALTRVIATIKPPSVMLGGEIAWVNDELGHEAVLLLLRLAHRHALAEAKEAKGGWRVK